MWWHAGQALLILAVSYALFTLLPGALPHPEDASPYAYAIAMAVCLAVWLRLPARRKWLYLPVLVLCLMALLDESGYGSEVMDIPPIYSQTLHVEIRDLHNAIAIGLQVLMLWLEEMRWNWPLFTLFVAIDAGLVAMALAFGWLLRRGLAKAKAARWNERAIWLGALFAGAVSLKVVVYLLSLPPDPRNALLFGYSATRLASVLGMLVVGLAPIALLFWKRTQVSKIAVRLSTATTSKTGAIALAVGWLVLLAGLTYQFYAPFLFLPDDRVRLARIAPLVIWAMAMSVIWLTSVLALRGKFRRSITQFIAAIVGFFRREPSYFYAMAAIALILVAQLNDKHILPIDDWIKTPGYHIASWGLWTEEVFETTGAFLFIAGALWFRDRNEKK